MRNLPQSLADLEFTETGKSHREALEEGSFGKILHRHFKDRRFDDMQRKIAEEYQNLREVAIEMGEAEEAFHKMMQARHKLVDVYRDLVVKSRSDGAS
jgi:flagellar hook-basal body complex protein FliE